jgi:hypothetical protein
VGEVKITRELLDSYQKYRKEIPLLENELRELWLTDKGFGSSVILDYRDGYPRPQSVVGFDGALYERRKTALARKKEMVKAVEEWINGIEDGQTRCIFRMYYIEGMSWARISQKTGYGGNADYPRIMIRDKYLKDMGIN